MINVVELKAYLNITENTHDSFLSDCCNKAIKELESECNRFFTSGGYTEWYDSNSDVYDLYLQHYPVRSFSSVKYESSDGVLTDVTDDLANITVIDNSKLHISGDYFPKGLIQTCYVAGYTVSGSYGAPDDFKKVLLEKAAMHYYNSPVSTQARLGVDNRNIGSQNSSSVSYSKPDHTEFINRNRYRNI